MTASIQWLRHALRAVTLASLVVVAGVTAYRLGHPGVGSTADADGLVWLRGNTWSMEVGPLSFTDPLAALESFVAGKALVPAILIGAAIPLLATALAGRVFCSWVCPAGFLLELGDQLRTRIDGRRRRDVGFWRGNKYALLAVGLTFSAALAAPLLGYFYAPAVFAAELHHWIFQVFGVPGSAAVPPQALTWGALFLLGIAAVELLVSRRMWCRYFCPGGALYSLLGRWRVLRVTRPDEHCDRCGLCVTACGMGLNPMQGITGLECDNCLACVSSCPSNSLHPTLARAGKPGKQ